MPFLEIDSNGNPIAEYGGVQPSNPNVQFLSDTTDEAIAWRAVKARQVEVEEAKTSLLTKYNEALALVMSSADYEKAATYSNMKTLILDLLSYNNLSGTRDVIISIPIVPSVPALEAIKSEMVDLLVSVI